MKKNVSRRFFLGSAAAGLLSPAAFAAPPTTSLRPVLRGEDLYRQSIPDAADIIAQANLSGRVSFALADATTGAVLEQTNPLVGMPPASVTKAITALYALDVLGVDHQFETRLLATGGIVNGEVQGDLILAGGADPTLNTDALAGMAAKLKQAGVTSVRGAFKVYESYLPMIDRIDPDQPDHVGYNPAVTGVALNYNRVHFEWKHNKGSYAVTMDGRSGKYRPEVAMAVMQIQDRASPLYTYKDSGARDDWTVAKSALGSGGARWLPVRKPGLYAGDIFATMAGAQGIRLARPQIMKGPLTGTVVVAQKSEPLREILRDMLKYSTNLTAEMAGLAATTARGRQPETLKDSAAEMNRWAKQNLGMDAPALVDHSGLGEDSRVSARDMMTALVNVYGSGTLKPIMKTVKLRDSKGRPMANHPIKVEAKTGTLNFVSALAGYMTAPNGRVMAFAIFAADEPRRATLSRAERERPEGGRSWNGRAKRLQQSLIERWGAYHAV
mgnify:FL=1|tara:strand:+ start:3952 stop:5445 length:1494 start_codon:yes stop_codon:yes gene_type:complete